MGELMKEFRHKCELELLVCEPHPLRPDRVTVGFVLRDTNPLQPRTIVRFAPDLHAVQYICPGIDLNALESTLLEMQSVLANVTDYNQFRQFLPGELSIMLDVVAGKAVITDDMEAEADLLTQQYLELPTLADLEDVVRRQRLYGRAYLKGEMISAFKTYGVLEWINKSIPVDEYSLKGDSLKIDFGFRNKTTNTYRMLDAVSLLTSLDRARILALSWPAIKDGKEQQSGTEHQLYAIVENGAREQSSQANDGWHWMEDRGIRVHPVSAMAALAADARNAMES
jgi:hypothetical protein